MRVCVREREDVVVRVDERRRELTVCLLSVCPILCMLSTHTITQTHTHINEYSGVSSSSSSAAGGGGGKAAPKAVVLASALK